MWTTLLNEKSGGFSVPGVIVLSRWPRRHGGLHDLVFQGPWCSLPKSQLLGSQSKLKPRALLFWKEWMGISIGKTMDMFTISLPQESGVPGWSTSKTFVKTQDQYLARDGFDGGFEKPTKAVDKPNSDRFTMVYHLLKPFLLPYLCGYLKPE